MDTAQRQISLLREYRTRLIVDVVTGKLDVRAAVAGLPDELADETNGAEPLDDNTLTEGDEDIFDDIDIEPDEAEE